MPRDTANMDEDEDDCNWEDDEAPPPAAMPWARSDQRTAAVYPPMDVYMGPYHVYEGCRLTIEGATGDGKSMLGLGMALAIARKEPFLHLPAGNVTAPVDVLYLDYEMGRVELQRRLSTFGTHPNFWVVCFDDPQLRGGSLLPIDTDEGEKQLIGLVNACRARVVFLDNLYSAVEGSIVGGSGDGQAHERVVPLLRRLSRFNVATVLLAHTNTSGDLYGDKRLTWQLTGRLRLTRIRPTSGGPDSGLLRATIEERKVRGGAMTPPYNAVLRDRPSSGRDERDSVTGMRWEIEGSERAKKRKTCNEIRLQIALACLADLAPVPPEDLSRSDVLEFVPRGRSVYDLDNLRVSYYDRLDLPTTTAKRQSFHRVIGQMVDRRIIGRLENYLWLIAD